MVHKPDSETINTMYPVQKITIYKNGCYKIIRGNLYQDDLIYDRPSRGAITKMSNNSLTRLIMVANSTDVQFKSMLTLTYGNPYPLDGTTVKDDLVYITKYLKNTLDVSYLWFLEFQNRGAPHMHILLTNDCITPRMRVNVACSWVRRVCTSDWLMAVADQDRTLKLTWRMMAVLAHQKSWELIKDQDGAKKYITKYATKQLSKEVPGRFVNVGRFWGCSADVPPAGVTVDVTDDEVRDFLEERGHVAARWDVLPKYLFNVTNGRQHLDTNGADL